MSEERKEVDAYKIFRQLEEKKKRANPYTFYDKDELIDEILKQEDEIDRLNNIINKYELYLNNELQKYGGGGYIEEFLDKLKELKENK